MSQSRSWQALEGLSFERFWAENAFRYAASGIISPLFSGSGLCCMLLPGKTGKGNPL